MLFKGLNGFISLLFTAGTILLLFFIILGGIKADGVTSHFYYFRAETGSITPGAAGITQWSFWGTCGFEGEDASNPGASVGCSEHHPAFGFDYAQNLGTEAPPSFERRHNSLYYISRFFFPFFVISLFFEVVKLFIFPFQYKSTLAFILAYISNIISFIFVATAASLVTAENTKARTAFNEAGSKSTHLGRLVIAFAWTCVFMVICQFFLLLFVRPARDATRSAGAGYSSGGYASSKKASKTKGHYRFGLGSKKTTEAAVIPADDVASLGDAAERSSYVRA